MLFDHVFCLRQGQALLIKGLVKEGGEIMRLNIPKILLMLKAGSIIKRFIKRRQRRR